MRNGENKMKKSLALLLLLTGNIFTLFAKTPLEHVKEKYAEYTDDKIESIGTLGKLSLFVLVKENDWFEEAVFFNSATKEISTPKEISEQAIFSARIVRTKKDSFFEIVGRTHNGHGNIYLFDSAGKLFFNYGFVDRYHEAVDYPDYAQIPCLRESVRNKLFKLSDDYFEDYSRVFENDSLNIDYSKYDKGILRIYGKCNYVGCNSVNDTSRVLGSDEIERIFVRDGTKWTLSQSKGSMENLPYLEPDKIFNLWEY